MCISPGTPQYPKQKRGSSASLSQVEDGYFKSGNSTPSATRIETSGNAASSMARIESSGRRSSGLSPNSDDGAGSMSKFATLPSPKGKGKKVNKVWMVWKHCQKSFYVLLFKSVKAKME